MSNPNNWLNHREYKADSFINLCRVLDKEVTDPCEVVWMGTNQYGVYTIIVKPAEKRRRKKSEDETGETQPVGDSESADANPEANQ
jgi:hypothetical protein